MSHVNTLHILIHESLTNKNTDKKSYNRTIKTSYSNEWLHANYVIAHFDKKQSFLKSITGITQHLIIADFVKSSD